MRGEGGPRRNWQRGLGSWGWPAPSGRGRTTSGATDDPQRAQSGAWLSCARPAERASSRRQIRGARRWRCA
eukprot:5882009-Pleurochrysis_carterae.AAC.1